MVTTNNTELLKKKIFFVLLFTLAISVKIKAQQDTLFIQSSVPERLFKLQRFSERFGTISSLINKANIQQFNFGELMYSYSQGNLRHPQDYKKSNGIIFNVASLAPLKNTNWTLYGSMNYKNIRKEDISVNLSYGFQEFDAPYYFFQQVNGLWNHQNYKFIVKGANQVSERLTIGTHFSYDNNSYFRKIDTRNETISLKMNGQFAMSYQLKPSDILSASLGVEYTKTNIALRNRYEKNKIDNAYTIYLNTGLGAYLKNITQGAETRRTTPELQLYWLHKKENYDFSAQTRTRFGTEKWIDIAVNRVGDNNVLTKYDFFEQNVLLNYTKFYAKNYLSITANGTYLNGKGSFLNNLSMRYINNYKSNKYTLRSEVNFVQPNALVNILGLAVEYQMQQRKDLNYGYILNQEYIKPTAKIGVSKKVNSKTSLFTTFNTSYFRVLYLKHDPFVANNVFVNAVGFPIANYLGTSTFEFANALGFSTAIQKNNTLEFTINTSYSTVANQPILKNSLIKYDDFFQLNCLVKYYF